MPTIRPVPITVPGVYTIPADHYHADPVPGGSLSSTGARKLLAPSCPALFRHDLDHPPPPKASLDLGHAAHRMTLGAGPRLVRIPADVWRTTAVKEKVAQVRAEGGVPLRPKEWDQIHAMAAKLLEHPLAAALFRPGAGAPEQTIVWCDEQTGVWRRAMLDFLPHPLAGRRLILVDYKTAESASPYAFARAAAKYGYYMQAPWYEDAVTAVGLAEPGEVAFLFVVQEKDDPFLVSVCQLDEPAMELGRRRNRRALEVFRDCSASGVWPGYSPTPRVELIGLPRYVFYQSEEEE